MNGCLAEIVRQNREAERLFISACKTAEPILLEFKRAMDQVGLVKVPPLAPAQAEATNT